MRVADGFEESLAAKFTVLFPHLDERQRRLLMGAEARVLGHGGIRGVGRAAGVRGATGALGGGELGGGRRGRGWGGPRGGGGWARAPGARSGWDGRAGRAGAASACLPWARACGRRCW